MNKIIVENSNVGMGVSGWLTLIFVTFKLIGVLSWSWWWVLSPLWIPLGLVLLVCIIVFGVAFLLGFMEARR